MAEPMKDNEGWGEFLSPFMFDPYAKEKREKKEYWERRMADGDFRVPTVGQRILFNGGMCGMGFLWDRHEARVLEVGETSCRIQILRDKMGLSNGKIMWIHFALITDFLGEEQTNG